MNHIHPMLLMTLVKLYAVVVGIGSVSGAAKSYMDQIELPLCVKVKNTLKCIFYEEVSR